MSAETFQNLDNALKLIISELYNSHWEVSPFPTAPMPHKLNLKLIRMTVEKLLSGGYAFARTEILALLDSLKQPDIDCEPWALNAINAIVPLEDLSHIAIYDVDKLVHSLEVVYEPIKTDNYDKYWTHQHKRAQAFYYCQKMQEMLSLHEAKNIEAAKYILDQCGQIESLRQRAIVETQQIQLQTILGILTR